MFVLMLSHSIRVMDPNSSLGKICLGEDVVVISSDKVEGSGDWNSLEFQDTANSGQKKGMVFYQMDTEEISDRFVALCFVNGLEAYDGEINIGVEENMISNKYAVKLCLEYEVKRGNKVVKKELIVALRGEIYFVKFIINPEEDDVKPGVIFSRSFLRMTKVITDFRARTVTIYPDVDPFLEETKEEGKSNTDWDHLLDFNIDDIPLLGEEGLLPFVCKMGKSSRNKKRATENLNFFYQDIGTSLSAEEERPIIETMAYNDKYKKILDEFWKDKVELDGKIVTEEEEAVGVTTLVAKFLILDIPIDRDSPIVVGHGFFRTIGAIVNTPERLFSTFDGFCRQTFCAARPDFMRNAESDSDDEEEYQIKRNKFGAPIYRPKLAPYLNCNDPDERSLAIQTTMGTNDDKARSSRSKRSRHETVEEFDKVCADDELQSKKIIKFRLGGCGHNLTLLEFARSISQEDNLGLSRSHTSTIRRPILRVIHKMITYDLCQRMTGLLGNAGCWLRSLSAPVYCRDLDTTTLRDLIDSDGNLIPQDPQSGVPRVGIPRPPRASMQDLYDRMGRMEIRQEAIERIEYRQSYHWDRYQGVFEHMAGVYSVPMQGAYNPPGYAQPQYDQCYQQYPPPPPRFSSSNNRIIMSSVDTRVGCVTVCFGSLMFEK
ncbi:hypothetical protein Tco_1274236 [Tanacetum coccineum]